MNAGNLVHRGRGEVLEGLELCDFPQLVPGDFCRLPAGLLELLYGFFVIIHTNTASICKLYAKILGQMFSERILQSLFLSAMYLLLNS